MATRSTDRLQSFDADERRADGSGGEPFGRSSGATRPAPERESVDTRHPQQQDARRWVFRRPARHRWAATRSMQRQCRAPLAAPMKNDPSTTYATPCSPSQLRAGLHGVAKGGVRVRVPNGREHDGTLGGTGKQIATAP
jgi:hypothetical protein